MRIDATSAASARLQLAVRKTVYFEEFPVSGFRCGTDKPPGCGKPKHSGAEFVPGHLREAKATYLAQVLAACLFVSPLVLGFADEPMPAWNAWIVGIALGVLAVAALSAFAEWKEWVSLVLGLWLVAAPWVFEFVVKENAVWIHVGLGVLRCRIGWGSIELASSATRACANAALLDWYKAQGCFTESIRYQTRLFVPLAESAPTISALRSSRILPNGI
jgi:hypothetical protein